MSPGDKYTKLTILKYSHADKWGKAYWWCECECGRKKTVAGRNLISGDIKSCGCSTSQMISDSKKGAKNRMWKGDDVGLKALHEWMSKRIPKPLLCTDCKKVAPRDLANISQQYKRDLSDWEWLCRRCHMKKDGRMNNLKRTLKLSKEQVLEMRKQYATGNYSTYDLSGMYGIGKSQVHNIIAMKSWII